MAATDPKDSQEPDWDSQRDLSHGRGVGGETSTSPLKLGAREQKTYTLAPGPVPGPVPHTLVTSSVLRTALALMFTL